MTEPVQQGSAEEKGEALKAAGGEAVSAAEQPSEPLVAAREAEVRLNGQAVLHGMALEVHEREIVTVVGPNGAGKTTLVRLLLGILPPSAGEVWRRPGLRIGYVPQRMAVERSLPLTVWRFLRIGNRAPRAALAAILAEVGAEGLGPRMVQGLSGGEFQRVLLARSLLRDPQLLILDEPASGVDVTGQIHLYELIARVRAARGCGVLLISHDLHLVMAATDKVVCLNGHICCSGRPETVIQDPAYVELFGARAAAALALYTHAHDHSHDAADVSGVPAGEA